MIPQINKSGVAYCWSWSFYLSILAVRDRKYQYHTNTLHIVPVYLILFCANEWYDISLLKLEMIFIKNVLIITAIFGKPCAVAEQV